MFGVVTWSSGGWQVDDNLNTSMFHYRIIRIDDNVAVSLSLAEEPKLLLAKAGVCELLLKLLEKHGPRCNDEETRSILKVACNLIVLILTGGKSEGTNL